MKTVTIDASAAASWLLSGQKTSAADAFLQDEEPRNLIAPDIFAWEIGNLLARMAKRNAAIAADYLHDLAALDIRVTAPREHESVLGLVDFAAREGLSLFDAAYLFLCLERGAGLASRDARLLDAARRAGVDVFDLRD
ncbi:type II toxin-antitoxin system VapC family toxin [Brevundimonas kwangchunensis]|uniref:Type II toxin-antitoxin system VapC family toxin n=1 Tax=Brevundimonas kwangchunensis TaxID=322163 RepID=A0ABP3S0V0_9CAUL